VHRFRFRGGRSRLRGGRSQIEVSSIVAVEGRVRVHRWGPPHLNNRELFRRDRNTCLYCGETFPESFLTRDHVVPRAQGFVPNPAEYLALLNRRILADQMDFLKKQFRHRRLMDLA